MRTKRFSSRHAPIPGKLLQPGDAGALLRERLFAVLDQGKPVVWISGPPGAGKTTLVATYLANRKRSRIWYQVDEGDSDPATFFYYLRVAATQCAPRKRWRLPLLTPEYTAGVAAFSYRWFEEFFNGLPASTVIVFDNYQSAAGSRVDEVVRVACERTSNRCRIIIISRDAAPAQFARLHVEGRTTSIGWDALRLTEGETAAVLRSRIGRSVSRNRVQALHALTEGWAAGLVLALEESATGEGAWPEASREAVFDYFAAEIFDRADPQTRHVLLTTALLPKVGASQAVAVSGCARASDILAGLARRRYFTHSLPGKDPLYEYHPMFREFLLARGRKQIRRDRRTQLVSDAASLLAHDGQPEPAAALLCEAADWPALARLILDHASTFVSQGRSASVEKWLLALPADALKGSPWLLYWLGVCQLIHCASDAVDQANRAYDAFAERGDRAGMVAAATLAIEGIFYGWGDFHAFDTWIAALQRVVHEPDDVPAPLQAQAIGALVSAVIWRCPEHQDLAAWVRRAESLVETSTDPLFRIRFGINLVQYHTQRGEIARAEALVSSLVTSESAAHAPPIAHIYKLIFEGHLCWIRADIARNRQAVDTARRIATSHGVRIVDGMVDGVRAYGELVAGNTSAARAVLETVHASIADGQWGKSTQYHYLAGWAAMLSGDVATAHAEALVAHDAAMKCGATFAKCICTNALAQTFFERGNREEASASLAESLRLAKLMESRHLEHFCRLVEADWALREGRDEEGLQAAGAAFALGREYGFLACGWWRRDVVSRVCTRALEANIEPEYARRLVQAHGLVPDAARPPPESWPWRVRVRALGPFEVSIDGQPVSFPRRAPRKPLELLKALVAFGSSGASERELADALWPEAEGDLAQRSLAVTLHRLRRLLTDDFAVHRQQGRLRLDAARVWVDSWAVESLLRRMADAGALERGSLLRRARELCRGPLLQEEEASWAAAARSRFNVRAARQLGESAADAAFGSAGDAR